MAVNYILVIDGKPAGPFSIEQLKALKVGPNDFVKTPGMDDYKEVHEVAELRELLNFKKQHLIPQYFGSFDQRLLAAVVDWLIVAAVCVFPALLLVMFITDKQSRLVIAFSLFAIIPLVNLIYHITWESSQKQATYGKQLLKIKVCDLYGERLSIPRSAGRNAAKIFSVITFFVGYLISYFNKKQQCLHDMIADTMVVKDRLI